MKPIMKPITPLRWLQRNLFSSWFNTLLTLFSVYLLYLILPPILRWAILEANWVGTTRDDCTANGACWVFIKVRFWQFIYGFYPTTDYWRVNLAFSLLAVLMLALMVAKVPNKSWILAFTVVGYPILAFYLFYGGVFGLPLVETSQWGGLMLTLILAIMGIVLSLPLGILLALGRRANNLPLVKALSIIFIEFIRGVPLITVLFMASVMLPLFLPEGVQFDKLLRALVGIVLFQAAYLAEVIRGGLQAIPKGQFEAADSLGLGFWQQTGLIILPQALKLVIPGIVNTFISLFKDTTLVLIIGLFDLLGIIQTAFMDPHWLGYSKEGYIFAGLIFWLFCFSMSRYSQYLEQKFHTGHQLLK